MNPSTRSIDDRSEPWRSTNVDDATEFEARIQQALVRRIGEPRYRLWFVQNTKFACDDNGLTIRVPNQHFQDWLSSTFGEAVREAATEVFGRAVPVRFVIDAGMASTTEPSVMAAPALPTDTTTEESTPQQSTLFGDPISEPPTGKTKKSSKAPRLGRRWSHLGDFVVGTCNRVAFAAAESVVEEPGQGANPLVLYGPTGTGKTHLLEGIYVGLRKNWPEGRIVFVTAEDFTNRFVQGMRLGRMTNFRRQFRDCSALLLDDLNFLTTKRATQEEFLHTFDSLVSDGRQVVVTCDCHPRLADELMPELADRLIGGAVWSLLPPDPRTRLDILRAKAAKGQPNIPEDVIAFLGERLRGNVRELEGALHSVRHFSRVTGRPVSLELTREALGELLRHAIRVVRVADVDAAVCSALSLEMGQLQSKQRSWAVSHPRMLAIFLARKHTAATFGDISRHFGNKTHSTAVAAEKKVRSWLAGDETLALGGREWRVRDLLERIERDLLR